jgi:hypothetical protein
MVEQPAVARRCVWHGCDNELTGRQKRFCGGRCKAKFFVTQRRKELKRKAVECKGGCCCICGYDRCLDALTFHHLDGKKDFGIGAKGYTRSWKVLLKELQKCLLVCANCHSEIHAGLYDVAALASNGQRINGVNSGNPQHFGWRQP